MLFQASRHFLVWKPIPSHLLSMKLSAQTLGAVIFAITCGTGGYFLGKSSANRTRANGTEAEESRMEKRRPIASHPVVANIDPKALRAKLDAEANPLTRFRLALDSLESWVAKDPKGALDWLATQQPSDRRNEVINMALGQFSEIDAKGAADWAMKNLSGADLNNTLITIAESWGEEHGREAAGWFLGQPATAERDAAIESLFFSWASNEPVAALDFLRTNPSTDDLAPILRRASLAGWVKSDPVAAVNASLSLSQANGDPSLFANTVANWATVDLETSSQWLFNNLAEGAERAAAAQELATIFAQQSPAAGVAWLDKMTVGAERNGAASALVATWSRVSPADAAKWAMTQQGSSLNSQALEAIAENFSMKDPAAFQTWRTSLPPGPMKDQAAKAGIVGSGG